MRDPMESILKTEEIVSEMTERGGRRPPAKLRGMDAAVVASVRDR